MQEQSSQSRKQPLVVGVEHRTNLRPLTEEEVRFEIEDTFPGLGRNGSQRPKAPMGYAPSPAPSKRSPLSKTR